MQNIEFDYYAFISYNHKDAKWARQLQQQLEHYRLPSALCKEQPELPKRITPVFLDSSDLVARSSLLESLRAKLDASNYLIVLCSPNSAAMCGKSLWASSRCPPAAAGKRTTPTASPPCGGM